MRINHYYAARFDDVNRLEGRDEIRSQCFRRHDGADESDCPKDRRI